MEATWATYKNKPATSSIYTEDAVVIYVPSGAGARGNAQIRRFYLQPDFKAAQIQEQVHGTVMSGNKVMEEVEWTITFHGSECNWLVPSVDEGLLVSISEKSVTRGLITLCNVIDECNSQDPCGKNDLHEPKMSSNNVKLDAFGHIFG